MDLECTGNKIHACVIEYLKHDPYEIQYFIEGFTDLHFEDKEQLTAAAKMVSMKTSYFIAFWIYVVVQSTFNEGSAVIAFLHFHSS